MRDYHSTIHGTVEDYHSTLYNLKRTGRFEDWEEAARKGDPDGQVLLGECYRYGMVYL